MDVEGLWGTRRGAAEQILPHSPLSPGTAQQRAARGKLTAGVGAAGAGDPIRHVLPEAQAACCTVSPRVVTARWQQATVLSVQGGVFLSPVVSGGG